MTYKKIVAHMVEEEAKKWAESVINKNICDELDNIFVNRVELENDKNKDTILFGVHLSIRFKNSLVPFDIEVGGTVDDLLGICNSCIWDSNHNIIWMANKETRDWMGIKTLNIA